MGLGGTQNNERLLGSTTYEDIDTNTIYEWKAEYDDNFTSDTPYIKVTANDEGREVQEYIVNIDEVDVSAASDIELFALCSYADAHEKNHENVKSSWELISGYISDELYPSELVKQYMLAKLKGESTEFCGDTMDAVMGFAKRTVTQLQAAYRPECKNAKSCLNSNSLTS